MFTKERCRRGAPVDKHGPISLGEVARNRLPAQRLGRGTCQPRHQPRLGLGLSRPVIDRGLKARLGRRLCLPWEHLAQRGPAFSLLGIRVEAGWVNLASFCDPDSSMPDQETTYAGCRLGNLKTLLVGAESQRR